MEETLGASPGDPADTQRCAEQAPPPLAGRPRPSSPAGPAPTAYLSFEMLQSMTVFLLVFTMMKGKWMTELGGGGRLACCSTWRFLCTRFLKAIC